MDNSSTLKKLLKEYDNKQMKAISDLEQRKNDLYIKFPRLQEIENELNSCAIEAAKSIISTHNPSILEDLQNKVNILKNERMTILKNDGKDLSYLSPKYECSKCKDTGYITKDGITTMCSCLKQKLLNIEYNNSNIGNLDRENFKKFNINLYSDEVNEAKYNSNISPRENIKVIGKEVKKFIRNFDNLNEKNLLFSGGTGLGKTFLSNCIVAELLSKGKTVLYQTAPVMLDTLISEMFSKNNDSTFSQNLLTVDLLVIDDLGTETMNSMKFTELYKIINTRLLNQNGKITKTIISTNLDLQGLFNTYDERIVSRFIGNYNIYRFFGDDIRFKK